MTHVSLRLARQALLVLRLLPLWEQPPLLRLLAMRLLRERRSGALPVHLPYVVLIYIPYDFTHEPLKGVW